MARLARQRDKLHDALVATTDHVELTRLGAELRAVQDELDGGRGAVAGAGRGDRPRAA